MSIDHGYELKDLRKLKEANLELCNILIENMEYGKPYSFPELIDTSINIIDTQLKPVYGDLEPLKDPKKINHIINELIALGFLKIREPDQGKLCYRGSIQKERLPEALSLLFSKRF